MVGAGVDAIRAIERLDLVHGRPDELHENFFGGETFFKGFGNDGACAGAIAVEEGFGELFEKSFEGGHEKTPVASDQPRASVLEASHRY